MYRPIESKLKQNVTPFAHLALDKKVILLTKNPVEYQIVISHDFLTTL